MVVCPSGSSPHDCATARCELFFVSKLHCVELCRTVARTVVLAGMWTKGLKWGCYNESDAVSKVTQVLF